MNSRLTWLWVLTFCVGLAACAFRPLERLVPCTLTSAAGNVPVTPVDKVDLLFIVDNSDSMLAEQQKVRDELPGMVEILVKGHDDANNIEDFPAVKSLRVGIITTDVGIQQNSGNFSGCTAFGDEALLRTKGYTDRGDYAEDDSDVDCTPSAAFAPADGKSGSLQLEDKEDAAITDYINSVSCIAQVGGGGCGLEQQLKAIDSFFDTEATQREQNALNPPGTATFFRPDALLAVILVTDEDDCTTDKPGEVFVRPADDSNFQGELICYRAGQDGNLTSPTEIATRIVKNSGKDVSNVVFAAITGVPDEGTINAHTQSDGTPLPAIKLEDYAAVLDHPLMVEVPNTESQAPRHPSRSSTVLVPTGASNDMVEMQQLVENEDGDESSTTQPPPAPLLKVTPTCWNSAGRAFPGRRVVQSLQTFKDEGVSTVLFVDL